MRHQLQLRNCQILTKSGFWYQFPIISVEAEFDRLRECMNEQFIRAHTKMLRNRYNIPLTMNLSLFDSESSSNGFSFLKIFFCFVLISLASRMSYWNVGDVLKGWKFSYYSKCWLVHFMRTFQSWGQWVNRESVLEWSQLFWPLFRISNNFFKLLKDFHCITPNSIKNL